MTGTYDIFSRVSVVGVLLASCGGTRINPIHNGINPVNTGINPINQGISHLPSGAKWMLSSGDFPLAQDGLPGPAARPRTPENQLTQGS